MMPNANLETRRSPANTLRSGATGACLLALMILAPSAQADDLAEKGRAILKKNQRSVITIELQLQSKMSMGGMGSRTNESRQAITGTVLDPTGLTVVSLSATDPGQMLQNVISGMSSAEAKFKMETELGDVKMLLDDGSQVPVEVVLRDRDLDLAFPRPKTKLNSAVAPLDLSRIGKADLLDPVIALNRLSSAAGRACSASVERVAAILERPKMAYVPETSLTTTSLGCPAFTLDGAFLGLFVVQSSEGKSSSLGAFNLQPENVTPIILPADNQLKAIKQVPPPNVQRGHTCRKVMLLQRSCDPSQARYFAKGTECAAICSRSSLSIASAASAWAYSLG